MKRYQLLVEWSVVLRMRELPARGQRAVHGIFLQIQEVPDAVSEFQITDANGRQLDSFVCQGLAFYYWIDFADRHVKILAVESADSHEP